MAKKDVHYRYGLPTKVTVEVDTREQYPIRFPATIRVVHPERPRERLLVKVKTQKVALDCGDYRLAEYPTGCVVERKAGQRELWKNLFNPKDMVRQAKSFRKLAAVECPYLLVELTPAEILRKNPYIPDTEALLSRLGTVIAKYGFQVLWIPWRTRRGTNRRLELGTFLVHLMLTHGLRKSYDIIPEIGEV